MAYFEVRPRQTLFKYVTEEGFKGIVGAKRLWFSDLAVMNDPKEIVLAFEQLKDAFKAVRPNYTQEVPLLERWLELLEQHHKNVQMFCSCFSLENDLQQMWSEYAANHTGLAIGFRPSALFGIPARIQQVKYLDPDTPDSFRQLATRFSREISSSPTEFQLIVSSVDARAAMTSVFFRITSRSGGQSR
jgi:hypothetical protein